MRTAPPVSLPAVTAPSLEGITVVVPPARPVTIDDVARRCHQLARQAATTRERKAGEPVALGDEVCVDMVATSEGALIPFTASEGTWVEVAPVKLLPGLFEALVGVKVGASTTVTVRFPPEYPLEAFRGEVGSFSVKVTQAREVKAPDLESPAFIAVAKRGTTFEAVVKAVGQELADEYADQAWLEAENLALDEVWRRTAMSLPIELIDEEIRRRWERSEGAVRLLDATQRQQSLEAWLSDELTLANVTRSLGIALALKAIAERDGLKPDSLRQKLDAAAKVVGVPVSSLRTAFATEPALAEQVVAVGFQQQLVAYVMSKVRFSSSAS